MARVGLRASTILGPDGICNTLRELLGYVTDFHEDDDSIDCPSCGVIFKGDWRQGRIIGAQHEPNCVVVRGRALCDELERLAGNIKMLDEIDCTMYTAKDPTEMVKEGRDPNWENWFNW